jgi:hypothetical protein
MTVHDEDASVCPTCGADVPDVHGAAECPDPAHIGGDVPDKDSDERRM